MDYIKEKISVIVPMHNSENTIERCVNSIKDSTYKNIEIVLIDDGSTDNTFNVCTKLKEKNNNILLMSTNNSSAGLSRQQGIDIATGEFIGFVDADDYIDKEMYEKMYCYMNNNNLDVCMCGNNEIYSNGRIEKNNIRLKDNIYEREKIQRVLVKNTIWYPPECSEDTPLFSIWRGLYRKDVIKKNNIRFLDEHVYSAEDRIFNYQVFINSERIGFIKECYYNYTINAESLTNNGSRWEETYDYLSNNFYKCVLEYAREKGVEKYIKPYLDAEYLGKARKSINEVIDNSINFGGTIKRYKSELEKFIYLKNIHICRTKGNGIRNKINYFICFYVPVIYTLKRRRRINES